MTIIGNLHIAGLNYRAGYATGWVSPTTCVERDLLGFKTWGRLYKKVTRVNYD